jgi:hypothetical protein
MDVSVKRVRLPRAGGRVASVSRGIGRTASESAPRIESSKPASIYPLIPMEI